MYLLRCSPYPLALFSLQTIQPCERHRLRWAVVLGTRLRIRKQHIHIRHPQSHTRFLCIDQRRPEESDDPRERGLFYDSGHAVVVDLPSQGPLQQQQQ